MVLCMSTKSKKKTEIDLPVREGKLLPAHDAASHSRNGHWTISIKPRKAALIAQMLRPCHLVIQNHGPGQIWLVAQDGDLMDLPSGNLRATYVRGALTIEVRDDKQAVVELEFLPVFLKY